MTSLLQTLTRLFEKEPRFIQDGKLQKHRIVAAALDLDAGLLRLLRRDERVRAHFFRHVDGVLVFDKIAFVQFVQSRDFLPDSYTAYKNKIGLIHNEHYLGEGREVVLAWPYKDCVLEGGQTQEDARRNEVFLNRTLAADEIDRLFEPKALVNFKLFTPEGTQEIPERVEFDQENLVIKGNNLLVLHSLKPRYAGQVKLIYIDPPYNTGNDSFGYNDRFNHSTWLTFMKNRLEVAFDFLHDDGIIWVSLNDCEAHYLKVLADELFGRENFIADVIWNSTKSVTNTALISDAHTHNLVYAKNVNVLKENRVRFRLAADASRFANPDNDPRGKWVADPFQVGGIRPNQQYPITNPKTGKVYYPNPGCSWKNEKKVFDRLLAEGRIVFGAGGESGPQRKRFWSEAKVRGRVATTLWKDLPTTTDGTNHLKQLFGEKVFENPKPEGFIQRILELATEEGDLVLDYHLGSGTTAAVAHKMNRRYIGIEQMDYIGSVAVQRLQKVIGGEQGGISKSAGWQGGGRFIYCELARDNDRFLQKIIAARTTQELQRIWQEMKKCARFDYRLDPARIDSELTAFRQLPFRDQQKILADTLDMNMLYVNYSEIDDEDYAISSIERALNRVFYGER